MIYCVRCLYPANHPLNIVIDDDGLCSGCRVHEEKDRLDWNERSERLRRIFDEYRSRSGRSYDCIIPVTGARDSYFVVHLVKYVYGMNPLLVTYNKHYNTQIGIRNLNYLRSLMDCDLLHQMVGPQRLKRITRATIDRLGSIYWHCLAGQTIFPVQAAVRLKIPLIVWGAHQGCDQVGMFSHLDEVEMTRKYRKDHDLMGCEAEDLMDGTSDVTLGDVHQFMYPHDKELEKVGVRGIYLSNYVRWDTKAQHEMMIDKYGYETAEQQRTFDRYNDVDCFHYTGLHDLMKFVKWGYGKVTDHASREIRFGRLTREEGIALVRRYRDVQPADLSLFLEWIGMTQDELFSKLDCHRDPRIWGRDAAGERRLRDSILEHQNDLGVDDARLTYRGGCNFVLSPARDPEAREERYYLMRKGYVIDY
jgi:N-acetyl sugar amidotransferase